MDHAVLDTQLLQPGLLDQVDVLLGDSSKARDRLGWEARVGFDELVRITGGTPVDVE